MIALFTDFGLAGPYVGQMHLALARCAPELRVIDLFHYVPAFDIRSGAYLLPAYSRDCPEGTVIVAVVDPGVGGTRRPVLVEADGRRYVGPDNGLFELVVRRAAHAVVREIDWHPDRLSSTFHGRDLFAPVAAMLARGEDVPTGRPTSLTPTPWPDDLACVLYIDEYGNAITGMRAASLPPDARIRVGERLLHRRQTFEGGAPGTAFWYENSSGLVECALNRGRAAAMLDLAPGDEFTVDA